MVECFSCKKMFTPDPGKLRAFAESGYPFDPTDWECEDCRRASDPAFQEDFDSMFFEPGPYAA